MGSGGENVALRRWLWMVVGGDGKSMAGRGWWWLPILITYFIVKVISVNAFLTPYVPRKGEHFIFKEKWIEWA